MGYLKSLITGKTKNEYIKPIAYSPQPGIIEVHGDIAEIQRNMHNLASAGIWVHKGYKHWEYQVSIGVADTETIVNTINSTADRTKHPNQFVGPED
jgi:hypothetical protein